MNKGEGEKNNLLQMLRPAWTSDAVLFWAIFTGFTVLMLWLLTSTTRNLLHKDTVEKISSSTNLIAATLTPHDSFGQLQVIRDQTPFIAGIALLRGDDLTQTYYQTQQDLNIGELLKNPEFMTAAKFAQQRAASLQGLLLGGWNGGQRPVLVVAFNGADLRKPFDELDWNNAVAILVAVLVGTILGWFILKRNMQRVTMLRMLREAGKMEALGRMAGGVAHEFNNLLHIISGNLDLLLKKSNAANDEQLIAKRILEASARGGRIVEQLLKSTHQSTAIMAGGNLNELTEKTVALFRSGVRRDCFFNLVLADNLPSVRFDESQIQQVILNLLFNAADAVGAHGSITIRTGVYERRRPLEVREFVFCEISDDGEGIPDEYLEKIFDPFFTTKPQGKGTGLGLSTCRGILGQHDGWIEAANNDTGGARFVFYLPKQAGVVAAAEIAPVPAEPVLAERKILGNVLLADDEPYCLDILRCYLEAKDCRLFLARDGREALFFAEKHQSEIDWVVTDWTMPGMEGAELVRELRKILPRARIIVVSGFGLDAENSPEVDAWVQKPFSPDELYQVLAKFSY